MGGGKGGGSAPKPDPQIGAAALRQAQLGEDWLAFAKEQFGIANERQQGLDELTRRIGESQLATQDMVNQWAQEDRTSAMADREWALGQRDAALERSNRFYDLSGNLLDSVGRYTDRANAINSQASQLSAIAGQYRNWANQDRRFALDLREDYDKFRPVNERLISDAMNWDSDARLADRAAEARADVLASSAAAQQAQQRQMASMGVNPNSGRFQSADRLAALQTGLSAAGAQNAARSQARQEAVGMRQGVATLGQNVLGQSHNAAALAGNTASLANATDSLGLTARQLANATDALGLDVTRTSMAADQLGMASDSQAMGAAGFAAGQYNAGLGAAGLGVNAGSAAQGGALANQSSFLANAGLMGQGYQGAMGGYANQANILNSQYQNQLQAWSANQQASAQGAAGLWGAVGSGLGMYAAMASSKDIKTKKKPVKGALQAVKGLPVESWEYTKEGQKRPISANMIPPDGNRHIGPYAEDFARETGIGDGKTIPIQDAIGITMKAVQELDDKVDAIAGKKSGRTRAKERA